MEEEKPDLTLARRILGWRTWDAHDNIVASPPASTVQQPGLFQIHVAMLPSVKGRSCDRIAVGFNRTRPLLVQQTVPIR